MRLLRPTPFLLAATLALCGLPGKAASPAPVSAANGMVVSAQHHATEVGVAVLREGGALPGLAP